MWAKNVSEDLQYNEWYGKEDIFSKGPPPPQQLNNPQQPKFSFAENLFQKGVKYLWRLLAKESIQPIAESNG